MQYLLIDRLKLSAPTTSIVWDTGLEAIVMQNGLQEPCQGMPGSDLFLENEVLFSTELGRCT